MYRDILAAGPREDRAVAYVYAACIIAFVAQWPIYARRVAGFDIPPGTEEFTLSTWLTYGAFAWLILAPIFFYAAAAVTRLVARVLGGRGTHYSARIALFWALLACAPVLLLYGMTVGFIGPGIQANVVGAFWVAGFGFIWMVGLWTTEKQHAG